MWTFSLPKRLHFLPTYQFSPRKQPQPAQPTDGITLAPCRATSLSATSQPHRTPHAAAACASPALLSRQPLHCRTRTDPAVRIHPLPALWRWAQIPSHSSQGLNSVAMNQEVSSCVWWEGLHVSCSRLKMRICSMRMVRNQDCVGAYLALCCFALLLFWTGDKVKFSILQVPFTIF
jgi:hypothetical protein